MVFRKVLIVLFISTCGAQLKFGGSSSSSGSASTNTKASDTDTDTRFLSTGNQALDGGILGLGAGLLGGAVLSGALNNNAGNGCGRRRRQAEGTNTKFLGALLGGGSNCNCGRRKRQAPGENQPGTRFFGLENLLGGGNNCCNCGYTTGNRCQCRNDLTFQDQYGNIHGACRRADETGRVWCYTTGYGCSDARQSQRFPNNPWSYQACGFNGKK